MRWRQFLEDMRAHLNPDMGKPRGQRFDHLFPLVPPRVTVVFAFLFMPIACVWSGRHGCEALFVLFWPLAVAVAYFRGVWPFKLRTRNEKRG